MNSYPSAIIYINHELSEQVKSAIQRQLFIHQTFTVNDFDDLLLSDGYYINEVRGKNKRILVIADYSQTLENKDVADVILTFKNGLLYVLDNKVGPPGITMNTSSISINKLFYRLDNE